MEGELVGPGPSDSTAGEVERGSHTIIILPAMHFMMPICDISTFHTHTKRERTLTLEGIKSSNTYFCKDVSHKRMANSQFSMSLTLDKGVLMVLLEP